MFLEQGTSEGPELNDLGSNSNYSSIWFLIKSSPRNYWNDFICLHQNREEKEKRRKEWIKKIGGGEPNNGLNPFFHFLSGQLISEPISPDNSCPKKQWQIVQ